MNLGTHMPDGERRKPIDIEVYRSKVKVLKHSHKRASNITCESRVANIWMDNA
jgi:hypothetical protein